MYKLVFFPPARLNEVFQCYARLRLKSYRQGMNSKTRDFGVNCFADLNADDTAHALEDVGITIAGKRMVLVGVYCCLGSQV